MRAARLASNNAIYCAQTSATTFQHNAGLCCTTTQLTQHGVEFRDLIVARQSLQIPFHEHQIENWLKQLAAGLAHLHNDAKLVHQDLHNGAFALRV